jgi:hypothetical protein
MAVYGAATGNYSAASIRAARSAGRADAGDQIIRQSDGSFKFKDNTKGTNNYSGNGGYSIDNMYDQQTNSQIAQLRAAIRKSIREQTDIIKSAPQKYQPLRNESEVKRNDDLRSVLEQNANAGDRGGVGRQNALETQTEADNRLNSINLQQQNVIDAANQNIADIKESGSLQEREIRSANAAARIRDIIAENQRTEDQQRADAAAEAAAKQQEFENYLKEREVNYETGKPYYKPSSGGSSSGGLTKSQIISAYNAGLIDDATASQMLGFAPAAAGNYEVVDQRLSKLSVPSSKVALIKTYNQQGKLSDAEAQDLLTKYGLG